MQSDRWVVTRVLMGALAIVAGGPVVAGSLELELGATTQYFIYEESDVHMKEAGPLFGAAGTVAYRTDSRWGVAARGRVLAGALDYDGQTWGGVPVETETEDWIVSAEALVGLVDDGRVTQAHGYTGLGRRYWNQVIEGSGGYEREITWTYLPVGVSFTKPGTGPEQPGLTSTLELRILLDGDVKSHLSDVDPQGNDPQNDVDSGYGAYVSFSVDYRLGAGANAANVRVTPYLEYWKMEASDYAVLTLNGVPTGDLGYEPENETHAFGVDVLLRF